jgi:hypothetical protein
MAVGRALHWIGVVCLIAATALLVLTCIGAPAVNDIGLLKVTLNNASDIRHSSVVFGPFGYCVLDVAPAQTDQDYCPKASVGYIPAQVMKLLDPTTTWTTWGGHGLDLMTEAFILFPIALAFAFFAAAFAFCGVMGSVIAAFLCALGWVASLAIIVVAFISMGRLKHHVKTSGGLHASYGVGMWTALAAMILLFFAIPFLFFSCCSGLRGKRRDKYAYKSKQLDSEYGRSSRSHEHEPIGDKHHGRGHVPVGPSGVPNGTGRQHHTRGTMRGEDYETVPLAGNHHNLGYAPIAAVGAVGAAAAAPRDHRAIDPLGERQALAQPVSNDVNQQYPLLDRMTSTPVHAFTTYQGRNQPSHFANPAGLTYNLPRDGNTITHHHPTTTTNTSTYGDGRGGFSTDIQTRTHHPSY